MLSTAPDRYRPDIDGLRAIAVMLVVNYHAFPEAMPGGFIGVDVFFVISGFLITGIITRQLGQQRFSVVSFYDRRIRRIFPALIVVLCSALVLGWFWMLPLAYAQLSSDVFASVGFVANIALWLQSGYFDLESGKKPLLHLWSLGIEEQFYLFWPLILMLVARLRLSIGATASAVGLASFVLNVALIGSNPVATFYLPLTRAWELLAGAVLACGWRHFSQTRPACDYRACAGLSLIAIGACILDVKSAFPGWWAILPVAGSVVLLSAPASWVARRLLSFPPLVWIGLISYPLYLWHWPLLVFFGIVKFAPLTLPERELILLLSVLLAWITYRFVEAPIRFGQRTPLKIAGLCTAMVLIAAAGAIVFGGHGFDFRLPVEIREMADVRTESAKWRVHECLLDLSREMDFAETCVDRGRRPLVLLWGDSTAGALVPGLRKAQEIRDFGIAQFTSNSCLPALNVDVAGVPNCRAINGKVLAIARDIQPDIVLLHGGGYSHLEHVSETVLALKRETNARVVVLGPVPTWRRGLPNEVLRYYMLHHNLIPKRSSDAVSGRWPDEPVRDKLVPLGAEFISVWDAMCNAEGCLTRIGDKASDISISDQVHLTEKGSVFLVQSVLEDLLSGPARRSSNAVH